MTIDNIFEEIEKANKIVLLTHETPDGDAIGSILAMKLILEKLGKSADAIITEIPSTFKFLPGAEKVKSKSDVEQYDLAITLDCAVLKRADGKEYFEKAKKTIVIDHHGSNTMYGDINYVNPVAPACCEVLAGMLEYKEIDIDINIGTCILAGIITDTGGFKYSSVTAETFEFTAELISKGVNVSEIYTKVLETKTKANFELSKRATNRLEFLQDGKVAFTYLTADDMEEVNAQMGDHEGIVEIGRGVEGVEVSIFIRENDERNAYKVSLRANSNSKVNVSDVCYMFGGGGHQKAAGALIQGNREEVKEKIIKEVVKHLNKK